MSRAYARRWLAACALAFAGATFAAEPWTVEGRVVGVADGDTITILDRDKRQHKIRFNGIDAPRIPQHLGIGGGRGSRWFSVGLLCIAVNPDGRSPAA